MEYSKLFGKTIKESRTDLTMRSHILLYKAGYIRESVPGRYYLLPLGLKVRNKIIDIIRQEMNAAGAQEIIAPTLHPLTLWEETKRVDSSNFELMIIKDRRGDKFALGGTAEEMIVDLVRKFQISYRDLPFNIYQFSTKFRDEIRVKGGFFRLREFMMKDGYSFHTSEEDFEKEYKNMIETYTRIFKRVGLEAVVVPADNGYFGGDYCHEFNAIVSGGESRFFVSEDGSYIAHEDIAQFTLDIPNSSEELKNIEIIAQPEWVKTMDDNMKHYGYPMWRYLKNVVYKNRITGKLIIATIRGDLEVNRNKLEKLLGMVGLLDDATEEDLNKIGTKTGFVHSWGYSPEDVITVGDSSLTTVKNFIGGQKEESTDTVNVNYGRDFSTDLFGDIAKAEEGFLAPNGSGRLKQKVGLEIGNIFQLGQYYTTLMKDAIFTDSDGQRKKYFMGCYGIGIERVIASIIETYSDDKGIIWPKEVAPYMIHLVSLNKDYEDEVYKYAEQLYRKLEEDNIDVLWDERTETSAGEKFADADLLGMPYRVVVSNKTIKSGNIEIKDRESGSVELLSEADLIKKVKLP